MQTSLRLKHTHAPSASDRMDRLGIGLSTLCAIHCMATPVLMGFLPSVAHVFSHDAFHWITFVLLVGIAALTLFRSFIQHRRGAPLVLGLLGIALAGFALGADTFFPHVHTHAHSAHVEWPLEELLTFAGSVLLVVAHWKNRTLCKECPAP